MKRKRKIEKTTKAKEASKFAKVTGIIFGLAITIFITLSNFSLCGPVGNVVKNIILSAFGTFGYLFPIIIMSSIIIALYNTKKAANVKIYSLIILYIALICLIDVCIQDYSRENIDLFTEVDASMKRAMGMLSVDISSYSAGIIGTGASFILHKLIGKTGAIIVFSTISIITFLILFGLGISKVILNVLKAIIMFIPNLIIKGRERAEEDKKIASENEKILSDTIAKNKKANFEVTLDTNNSSRLVLDPLPERKKLDTTRINISPTDVMSKFYTGESTHDENKENLLDKMRRQSINEIMDRDKEIKPDDFFYTEKMKPMSELDISIPEPAVGPVSTEPLFPQVEPLTAPSVSAIPSVTPSTIIPEDKPSSTDDLKARLKAKYAKKAAETTEPTVRNTELKKAHKVYKTPPLSYLNRTEKSAIEKDPNLNSKGEVLVETLKQFGVGVTLTNITVGPSVTRFELKPDLGVKVSRILSLEDDIKLALAVSDMRIEAPIPGKPAIGIEVPNAKSSGVTLGDIVCSSEFRNSESKLTVAIGKDIAGRTIVTDLRKMPHLLIAGATGSGKSVCINSLITSLIYKSSPEEVKMIMVDPKVVELQVYEGIPHLLLPVVTNPKKAASALNWAVTEMTRRYNLIQEKRVRDIESYNKSIGTTEEKLPYIVIIIDEFADLMMVAAKDVENSIMRIAQLARACGIYLVIATQRPSVNVISGSIKTNVPSRISFAVASGVDSQTILDRRGAEKLLGHGDMLYFPQGIPEPVRVQGCFVSEEEIIKVVNFVKDDDMVYDASIEESLEKSLLNDSGTGYDPNEKDEMFIEAGRLAIEQQQVSIGLLQRRFRMGFNRAARVIDQLEANGVISKQDGKKPREVIMTMEEFNERF